jgi:AcrR family transcriptional regulator
VPKTPPAGSRRGPRLSAEERRASILGAATVVFAESGYQRGRMSEIAARLGVTEPVVFQNFGSKPALYAAVVEHTAQAMSEELRTAAADQAVGDLLARLLSHDHIADLHAPGAAGFLFADALTVGEPEVETAARKAVATVADTMAELLRQGQSTGDLRADLDPEAAAWWLLSLMVSHRFRSTVVPGGKTTAGMDALVLRTLTG